MITTRFQLKALSLLVYSHIVNAQNSTLTTQLIPQLPASSSVQTSSATSPFSSCTPAPAAALFDKKQHPVACNCFEGNIIYPIDPVAGTIDSSAAKTTAFPRITNGAIIVQTDKEFNGDNAQLCEQGYTSSEPLCVASVPTRITDFAGATPTCDCGAWKTQYMDQGKHFGDNPCKGSTYKLEKTVDKNGKALTCTPSAVVGGGYAQAIAGRPDCYCAGKGAKATWLGSACSLATIY